MYSIWLCCRDKFLKISLFSEHNHQRSFHTLICYYLYLVVFIKAHKET